MSEIRVSRWSFLALVAAGMAWTVATYFGRLPTGVRGYYNRGVADSRAGRFDSALANLDRALALDPTEADAYVARATTWTRMGRPYRALLDADAALALEPGSSRAYYARGSASTAIGREQSALDEFARALDLDPRFARAALARGAVLFDADRFGDALVAYRTAHALRRNDESAAEAPLMIWAARRLAGDPDGADTELDEVLGDSIADRWRLDALAARARRPAGAPEPALDRDEDAGAAAWIEGVRRLSAGERAEACIRFRAASASAPASAWSAARAAAVARNLALGLRIELPNREISESLSFGPGLRVTAVRSGGPGQRAGIAAHDRIVRIAGEEPTVESLDALAQTAAWGRALPVEILHRGEPRELTLVVGDVRPDASAQTR